MRVIPLDDKVLELPAVNDAVATLRDLGPVDLELGERPRLALQLRPECVDVVGVDVSIAHDVRQRPGH